MRWVIVAVLVLALLLAFAGAPAAWATPKADIGIISGLQDSAKLGVVLSIELIDNDVGAEIGGLWGDLGVMNGTDESTPSDKLYLGVSTEVKLADKLTLGLVKRVGFGWNFAANKLIWTAIKSWDFSF